MSQRTHLQLLNSCLFADVRPRPCHWHHPSLPACLTPSHSHPPRCLFGCWVLFVYCFQMADTDFIWAAFKFPERFLLPWLKRLSCFLWSGFMMGPLYIATGNNCHYQSRLGAESESLSSSDFYIHTLSCSCGGTCLFFHGKMVLPSQNNKNCWWSCGLFQMWTQRTMTLSLLMAYGVILYEDLAECCLGIIKVHDIMYLQEPRRETCPSKRGGGPVNVFTHRMRF